MPWSALRLYLRQRQAHLLAWLGEGVSLRFVFGSPGMSQRVKVPAMAVGIFVLAMWLSLLCFVLSFYTATKTLKKVLFLICVAV